MCGPSRRASLVTPGEVATSSPPTCRRRVSERPRRENQGQRAMSNVEELRQNQRERQRREFTGKRLRRHNDTRDLVSGWGEKKHKKNTPYVLANSSVHAIEGSWRIMGHKFPCGPTH